MYISNTVIVEGKKFKKNNNNTTTCFKAQAVERYLQIYLKEIQNIKSFKMPEYLLII